MKSVKITKYILLICLTVLFLWVIPLFAEDDGDEGIDPIQLIESEILARLNLARSDPWAEAERLGLDPEVLRAEVVPEEVAAQWDQGLWPLAPNALLNDVARLHGEDMIERGFFSHVTPEGLTPEDRVFTAGYFAEIVREEMIAIAFNSFLDPGEATQILMDFLLRDSLTQRLSIEESTLLNERGVEAGIALSGGETVIEGIGSLHVYVLCIVTARPTTAWHPVQCGHVCADVNSNGWCDPDECLPDVSLNMLNKGTLAVSNARGAYCFARPGGWWVLEVAGEHYQQSWLPDVDWVDGGVIGKDIILPKVD
jgi:hypothetical protein